jgi:hypothetical protein
MVACDQTADHSVGLGHTHRINIYNVKGLFNRSFFIGKTQCIAVGRCRSAPISTCCSGVPQGSVFGPLHFVIHVHLSVGNLITAHEMRYFQYVYDTLTYMAIRPNAGSVFPAISQCVNNVRRCSLENRARNL